jgi:DNA-binding XRE family transcriptional regulator
MKPNEFRSFRKELQVNQSQLAQLLGLTQAKISDKERGELPISRRDELAMVGLLLGQRIVFTHAGKDIGSGSHGRELSESLPEGKHVWDYFGDPPSPGDMFKLDSLTCGYCEGHVTHFESSTDTVTLQVTPQRLAKLVLSNGQIEWL